MVLLLWNKITLVYLKNSEKKSLCKSKWKFTRKVQTKTKRRRNKVVTVGVKGVIDCIAECRFPHKSLNSSMYFPSMNPLKPTHQIIPSDLWSPRQPLLSTNCGGRGYEICRIWKRQLFVFTCRHVCACVHVRVFICALEAVCYLPTEWHAVEAEALKGFIQKRAVCPWGGEAVAASPETPFCCQE